MKIIFISFSKEWLARVTMFHLAVKVSTNIVVEFRKVVLDKSVRNMALCEPIFPPAINNTSIFELQ